MLQAQNLHHSPLNILAESTSFSKLQNFPELFFSYSSPVQILSWASDFIGLKITSYAQRYYEIKHLKSWISEFSVLKVCKTNAISVFNQVVSEANKLKKTLLHLMPFMKWNKPHFTHSSPKHPTSHPHPSGWGRKAVPDVDFFFPFFSFSPSVKLGIKTSLSGGGWVCWTSQTWKSLYRDGGGRVEK